MRPPGGMWIIHLIKNQIKLSLIKCPARVYHPKSSGIAIASHFDRIEIGQLTFVTDAVSQLNPG
jgi:hypothetical protein